MNYKKTTEVLGRVTELSHMIKLDIQTLELFENLKQPFFVSMKDTRAIKINSNKFPELKSLIVDRIKEQSEELRVMVRDHTLALLLKREEEE